jgi:hypothetical protein
MFRKLDEHCGAETSTAACSLSLTRRHGPAHSATSANPQHVANYNKLRGKSDVLPQQTDMSGCTLLVACKVASFAPETRQRTSPPNIFNASYRYNHLACRLTQHPHRTPRIRLEDKTPQCHPSYTTTTATATLLLPLLHQPRPPYHHHQACTAQPSHTQAAIHGPALQSTHNTTTPPPTARPPHHRLRPQQSS